MNKIEEEKHIKKLLNSAERLMKKKQQQSPETGQVDAIVIGLREEVARLRLSYKTMQEQNANMESALEIAIAELYEYGENSLISDIKSVWRDGINGLQDWRKYEDAFDEDQISNQ